MKVTRTNLDGLILIEPNNFKDERGSFYESWKHEPYEAAGIQEKFVQDNVSTSQKDVLRGLHYRRDQ